MLTNVRAIRSTQDAYAEMSRIIGGFQPPAGGGRNVAFLVVRAAIRNTSAPNYEIPNYGDLTVEAVGPQLFRITAVRVRNEGHSEERCVQAFMNFARNPRFDARIEYVFTEREPCHDVTHNCRLLLTFVLLFWGASQLNTPVRYVASWLNAEETDAVKANGGFGDRGQKRSFVARSDVSGFRKLGRFK